MNNNNTILKNSYGTVRTYQLDGSRRQILLSNYQSFVNQKVGLFKFIDYFSDENECIELYFTLKYQGQRCKCGRDIVSNYAQIKPKRFRCRTCHNHLFPFSDTIFRKSEIQLSKLFIIIFALCSGSISSIRAQSYLGSTYKAAHRITILLRSLLYNANTDKFKGTVEIDEAFLGKGSKHFNWSSISTTKQLIIGIVERDSKKCRLFLAPDRKSKTIAGIILNNVEVGSTVYTDSWRGYCGLSKHYIHEAVDHSKREWVRGDVHTNSIENVWRHLKRNIRKTHIKITDKYMQQYVDEACWRHNSKGTLPIHLFDDLLRRTFYSILD